MPNLTLNRIFSLISLAALSISCAPWSSAAQLLSAQMVPTSTPAPVTAVPTSLPTPVPAVSENKRQPKQPRQKTQPAQTSKTKQPQTPQNFPTSSYVPATADFNLILGRPTTGSITASLYARSDREITIAYGTASANYTSQTGPINLKASVPQNIELKSLNADTTYFYLVSSGGASFGEHTFTTQRTPGSTFSFTIDADPHNRDPNFNGELYATTLANIRSEQPDFHINLGDTFMTEKVQAKTYAEAESTFSGMRPFFGIIGADAPLFLVNGNHEGELGWLLPRGSDKELPIWSTRLRELYYPNPSPNGFYTGGSAPDAALGVARDGYYAWTWGDALFIVLDPFWYTTQKPGPDDLNNNWNWTLGKAQYDWLKTTLEYSSSKFKFVFIHNLVGGNNTDARGGIEAVPFFEWGGKNADGSDGFEAHRPGWGKPIHQLLVENHVSALFHGHDHVFVKQDLDGIVYQECPQPSMTRYDNVQLAQDYGYVNGNVYSSSGHLRVTVTAGQTTVEYVRAYLPKDETSTQQNGQVAFTYTIE